jgi:hypothetical protein
MEASIVTIEPPTFRANGHHENCLVTVLLDVVTQNRLSEPGMAAAADGAAQFHFILI